jgi:hypothetical protein
LNSPTACADAVTALRSKKGLRKAELSVNKFDTLRALREDDHKLAAYCPTCERWAELDLERLIADGHAATIAS